MSYTVQSIVDQARDIYPSMSETAALRYFNETRKSILAKVPLIASSNTINVVADDPNYTYSSYARRIQSAQYEKSATEIKRLIATSKDKVDYDYPNWRQWGSSTPRIYFLDHDNAGNPIIQLIPAPDTTTSGTYPRLVLYDDIYSDLLIGDTIYDDVDSADVYITGIVVKWARTKVPADLPMRAADHQQCLDGLNRYHMNKGKEVTMQLTPNWLRPRRGWR